MCLNHPASQATCFTVKMAPTERKDLPNSVGEDDTDFLDVDLVEFHEDEFQDIAIILKVSDTSKDKVTFMIFAMNVCFTCFLVGYVPNYFYLWHTVKAIVLISYRWYAYKKMRFHYFLFDFCYFTNLLILVYLWLPPNILGDTLRGGLFTICFSFSMGPLLSAIVLWRNSLVLHSTDKMTSLFIHVSPALAMWGIRWFSTEEQHFPVCAFQTQPGADGCNHVDFTEIVRQPMLLYVCWQILYYITVEVWRKKRVEEREYATSYKWIVERAKQGFLFQIHGIFGPKYRKLMFIVWNFIYTIGSILLGYNCYHSKYFNVGLVTVIMLCACYNGASFYIDVFSQRYYFEKVMKTKPTAPKISESTTETN